MTKTEREELYDRVVEHYNNTDDATVRKTADFCETSKSTVHLVLTKRRSNPISAKKLEKNKKERHIRGGIATRQMYMRKKEGQ